MWVYQSPDTGCALDTDRPAPECLIDRALGHVTRLLCGFDAPCAESRVAPIVAPDARNSLYNIELSSRKNSIPTLRSSKKNTLLTKN
jgi:hypothetical protein